VIDMADAATETEEKAKTKKDQVTGDTLVWSEAKQDWVNKTMSPELYRQQKAAQTRQALVAGTAGLAAEGIQYGIGATIFGDPAIKAQGLEKARLAAELRKGPDYLTEAEKDARRVAALAPAERKAEAVQKRIEKIAASTGDFSARNFLAAGDAGIKQIAQQSLEVEADIAAEDVRRQQVKADQDIQTRKGIEEIDAMMLELRNKYIREPLHKFISDAGKLAGTLLAHAPGKTIDEQVGKLRAAKFDEKEISSFVKTFEGRPRAARKAADQLVGERSPNVVDTTGDTGKTPEQEKVAAPTPPSHWKDTSATPGSDWSEVEYTLQGDGNIVYTHPDGKRRMVRPGSKSHEAIMKIRPESGGEAGQQTALPEKLPTLAEIEEARARGAATVYMTEYTPLPDNKFRPKQKNDPDDPDDPFVQWNEADKSWIILEENGEPSDDDPLTLDMMKNSNPGSMEYKYYTLAKEAGLLEEGTSD